MNLVRVPPVLVATRKTVFDTITIGPEKSWSSSELFIYPHGQQGKTRTETNMDIGGQLPFPKKAQWDWLQVSVLASEDRVFEQLRSDGTICIMFESSSRPSLCVHLDKMENTSVIHPDRKRWLDPSRCFLARFIPGFLIGESGPFSASLYTYPAIKLEHPLVVRMDFGPIVYEPVR